MHTLSAQHWNTPTLTLHSLEAHSGANTVLYIATKSRTKKWNRKLKNPTWLPALLVQAPQIHLCQFSDFQMPSLTWPTFQVGEVSQRAKTNENTTQKRRRVRLNKTPRQNQHHCVDPRTAGSPTMWAVLIAGLGSNKLAHLSREKRSVLLSCYAQRTWKNHVFLLQNPEAVWEQRAATDSVLLVQTELTRWLTE